MIRFKIRSHSVLLSAKHIFFFLDKEWVKIITFSFVAYWLYAILRFAVLLQSYAFMTNLRLFEVEGHLRLLNIIPYTVLFLILGQVLGVILNNRLIAKSLLAGVIVTILVWLDFPQFSTVVLSIRGFFSVDNLYPCLVLPIGALIAMAYRNSILNRKMVKTGLLTVMIAAFVFLSTRQAIIFSRPHHSKSDNEVRYKADADSFSRLLDSLSFADKDWEKIFDDLDKYDVSGFFAILTHLRMEPGYILDYVYYHDEYGGFPVLYAHKSDETAFKNYEEYRQARGEIGEEELWDRVYGKSGTRSAGNIFGYLDHVMIDDTPEGYFQYVLLRIMGSQFYLFWHSGYNDQRPIFSYGQLREVLSKEKDDLKRLIAIMPKDMQLSSWSLTALDPWVLIHKAAEVDFAPSIIINKEKVEIKVVVFSEYKGLMRRSFLVSRAFPHLLLKESQSILIPYASFKGF